MRPRIKLFTRTSRLLALIAAVLVAGLSPARALTFAEWQATEFDSTQLANPAIIAPAADPDGDGLNNLSEFVFEGDPLYAETNLAPKVGTANGHLTLTYRERSNLSDTQLWLQGGDDLVHWATFNTPEEIARVPGSGYTDITLRDAFPVSTKRFLRLKLQMGFLPRLAPSLASAKMTSHYSVELRWNDPNGYEYGYAIDRQDPQTGNWGEIASLAADAITYLETTSNLNTGYTYRVRLLDDEEDILISEPFGPKDDDHDGIPDDLEIAGAFTYYNSSPNSPDTDTDEMPDLWELKNGLDPSSAEDANGDLDGDGVSNYDEYLLGTDPNEFFNGVRPTIIIEDGDFQYGPANQYLPLPITAAIYKPDGTPWPNAPITLTSPDESGSFSESDTPESVASPTLTVRADTNGQVKIYWKAGAL